MSTAVHIATDAILLDDIYLEQNPNRGMVSHQLELVEEKVVRNLKDLSVTELKHEKGVCETKISTYQNKMNNQKMRSHLIDVLIEEKTAIKVGDVYMNRDGGGINLITKVDDEHIYRMWRDGSCGAVDYNYLKASVIDGSLVKSTMTKEEFLKEVFGND
jgi:hypothetical protein